jgi:chromosomal replication initiator protein
MHCQIVITSDRPPQEIPDMTQRFLNRLSGGLITDIQPPDFETRMAILQQKSELDGIQLPQEVIGYVANYVTTNIRELEGILVKLVAYSSFTGINITLDMAKEILSETIDKTPHRITLEKVQKVTCEAMGLSPNMIRTHTRKKEVAIARQVAMYLAKRHTSNSLKSIGLAMGGRDYSTVIHACKKIEGMLNEDQAFANKIKEIEDKLTQKQESNIKPSEIQVRESLSPGNSPLHAQTQPE